MMKIDLALWALISIVYGFAVAMAGIDVSTLFQLGSWQAGITKFYWVTGAVIAQVALLISFYKEPVKKLAMLLNAPIFLTLYIKTFYFYVLGYFFTYQNDILINVVVLTVLAICYLVLIKRIYAHQDYLLHVLALSIAVVPLSYQFAYSTKQDSQIESSSLHNER